MQTVIFKTEKDILVTEEKVNFPLNKGMGWDDGES